MSHLERLLDSQIKAAGLPSPQWEHKFAPGRRWRFDLAWPGIMVALEVEGGTRDNGRHSRHAGYETDCEKYNWATLNGWRVFRVTGPMVADGRALQIILEIFRQKH